MKKLLAILLVAVMCFSMSGCGLIINYVSNMDTSSTTVETTDEPSINVPAVEPEEESEEEPILDLSGLEYYDYSQGIYVVMEPGMVEYEADGFTVYAYNDSAMFAGIREDAEVFASAGLDIADYDLVEYADIVQQGNGLENPFTLDSMGNLYVTYNSNQNGTDFFYYATVKEGNEAFWVITFACFAEDEAEYRPQFELWASTIVAE